MYTTLKNVVHKSHISLGIISYNETIFLRSQSLKVSDDGALHSRRSFIQESKHRKHPNDGTVLMIIHFLNHAIVIKEEQFILNKTFPQDIFFLFKLVYFLLHLIPYITYHTLHANTSFFDYCALLELRYLQL
jgi:hypothetical protein